MHRRNLLTVANHTEDLHSSPQGFLLGGVLRTGELLDSIGDASG